MRVLAILLLALSPVLAYQVTYPGSSGGWDTAGPNHLLWQQSATDPPQFAAVLVDQHTGHQTVLEDGIDGSLGMYTCETPSGGWPIGPDFQVNIAQDSEHLTTLLAHSDNFAIVAAASNKNRSTSRTIDLLVVIAALTTFVATLL